MRSICPHYLNEELIPNGWPTINHIIYYMFRDWAIYYRNAGMQVHLLFAGLVRVRNAWLIYNTEFQRFGQ